MIYASALVTRRRIQRQTLTGIAIEQPEECWFHSVTKTKARKTARCPRLAWAYVGRVKIHRVPLPLCTMLIEESRPLLSRVPRACRGRACGACERYPAKIPGGRRNPCRSPGHSHRPSGRE